MTCSMSGEYVRGGIATLRASFTADTVLDAQMVSFSWDHGVTWHTAAWVGDPGTTRVAEYEIDPFDLWAGTYKLLGVVGTPTAGEWIDLGDFTVVAP